MCRLAMTQRALSGQIIAVYFSTLSSTSRSRVCAASIRNVHCNNWDSQCMSLGRTPFRDRVLPGLTNGMVKSTNIEIRGEQKARTSILEQSSVLCHHLSTSSYCKDSETDRVSQAYLGDYLGRSVQKHDGNRLIYEVRGQAMLRFVTLFFYTTAAVGAYLAPDFISSALENEALNQETIINLTAVTFAVIGLPASLRMLSKRLVLKLYHNEARETYHAITQSVFLTNKTTKFSLEDVVVKEKKSVLSQMFNLTTFKAKRQPLHVNPYNFKLPSDYNHLLGYDKI